MNLRAAAPPDTADTADTSDSSVEDLRRQIEAALGGVEEIVRNKGVISVATAAEAGVPAAGGEDEVVVYVSIKINKTEGRHRELGTDGDHHAHNGHHLTNGDVEEEEEEGKQERGVRKVVSMMTAEDGGGQGQGRPGDLGQGGGQGQAGDQAAAGQRQGGGVRAVSGVRGQAIRPRRRGKGAASVTAPATPTRSPGRGEQGQASKSLEGGGGTRAANERSLCLMFHNQREGPYCRS